MKTIFMLLARYDGKPLVSVDTVLEDFFGGMSKKVFIRKIESGEIRLPLCRLDGGQKALKGVAVQDLADYLDACSAAARKELQRKRTIRTDYSHVDPERLPDGPC